VKTVLIMRHAKSSWGDAGLSDFDRPLNKRGLNAAPRMGRLLRDAGLAPDRIVSSAAVRARETAELVAEAAGFAGELALADELYLADGGVYLDMAGGLAEDVACVLLIGHNPGIEELVSRLAGREETMPTAAAAHFEASCAEWADIASAKWTLKNLWRPRELEGAE